MPVFPTASEKEQSVVCKSFFKRAILRGAILEPGPVTPLGLFFLAPLRNLAVFPLPATGIRFATRGRGIVTSPLTRENFTFRAG